MSDKPHEIELVKWIERFAGRDPETNMWRLHSGATVPYLNDPYAENRLRNILKDTVDLTSLSPELADQGITWPASYYLSPKRTNLLRAFDWKPTARVMEVGSGCGSITRFLGETFEEVLAVEGHRDRAEAACLRTRDLPNVEVLNAPFQDLPEGKEFDIVFCIGVLEYASSLVERESPYEFLLEQMRKYLSKDGVLVLAIENRMGLKYFAGSSEDHSGIQFDGIEGYSRSGHTIAHTFSKKELKALVERAGYEDSEFYYPFPDYKLVDSVSSEYALTRGTDSLVTFLLRSQPIDYLVPPSVPRFDQQAVMRGLIPAGLADQLSNSFLVMASGSKRHDLYARDWDAVAFGIGDRLPHYWSRTEISSMDEAGATCKRRHMLSDVQIEPESKWVVSKLPSSLPWLDEPNLGTRVAEASKQPSFGVHELSEMLKPWVEYLLAEADGNGMLDGPYLDAIPQNLVRSEGELHFIDQEIAWRTSIPLTTVLIRGVLEVLAEGEATPGALYGLQRRSLVRVLWKVCSDLGFAIGAREVYRAKRVEAILQREVRGVKESPLRAMWYLMRHRIEGRSRLARSRVRLSMSVRRYIARH